MRTRGDKAVRLHVQFRIRRSYLAMRALINEWIGHNQPIPAFQRMNSHPVHSKQIRAGTFVRNFPDTQRPRPRKRVRIEGLEDTWYGFKNIQANAVLAAELRSTIRRGKDVPRRIAVNNAMAWIEDETDCRTSL